jgi:hypothetical protein
MMTLTIFGLLGLIGGVYSQLITEPEITITIYAPRGIIKSGSEVYSNVEKPSHVDTSMWHKQTQIVWYGKLTFSLHCIKWDLPLQTPTASRMPIFKNGYSWAMTYFWFSTFFSSCG